MPTITPRECLRITTEAVPGTYNGGGTATIIRLTKDNSFTGIPEPLRYMIRDAGSSNRLAQTGYGQVGTKCKLMTPWYFSQALIPLAIATGSGPLVLPTVTIDHMTMMEDSGNTKIYTRYLGCTVSDLSIACSNTPASIYATLDFDFDFLGVAAITVSDFPDQALSAYNTDKPVLFTQAAGAFSLHGARTGFRMFNMKISNINDVIYDESHYPQAIKWCGRNISAATDFRFKSLADRNDYQAQTAVTAQIAFTDGTNTGTFNFETASFINKVDDSLNLNSAHRQNVGWDAYLDYSAGLDFAYAQTP
jgi:hypothetical protein